jgi:peptidylprolyl isomerase
MTAVKKGDSVKVHYTGRYDTGEVFDTSVEGEPLAFRVGAGEVIRGIDQALIGMQVGESKELIIPPELAYGERIDALVQTINRDQFQLPDVEPEIGMSIEMHTPDGSIPLIISELTDTTVTLDANHILAGEHLHFELTLIEIAA